MPTLVYSDADGLDRSFALGTEPVTVGRAAECAIRSEDPRVSRMHARFFVEEGVLWIEDLGSSNGIFIGANKVSRAPVPTSEIILVGSLMIRLLPASGTLPPPMGLHGTLASWLDLERKARAAVEHERNAFARRVEELHQQIAAKSSTTLRDGSLNNSRLGEIEGDASDEDADLARLRTELAAARARVADLELERSERSERSEWSSNADVASTKLVREVARLEGVLDEAQAARSIAEHAAGEASRDSQSLRDELDQLRRSSHAELESIRLELAKMREAKMMAETAAGIAVAEKLAEADLVALDLRRELAAARAAANADVRVRELSELNTAVTGRADKAEKDLAAAQIRAQGAERNLSHASSQAAKAESLSAQLESRFAEADARAKAADDELAKARERIAALDSQLGAGAAPLQVAEGRAAELATQLAELEGQLQTRRDRLVELEAGVAASQALVREADARTATTRAELAAAAAKLEQADRKAIALQARLDQLTKAEVEIASAITARDEAVARERAGQQHVIDADRRIEHAEQRTSAADTMAKAMAKDVAEALRRAADADMRARTVGRELDSAHQRANQAAAMSSEAARSMAEAQRRVASAEARVAQLEREHADQLEATQAALGGKLAAMQRELAAERSSALGMVDRKTQVERELVEIRAEWPQLVARAEVAEQRAREGDSQIEALQDRVLDLESGLAVSETAQQASLDEARAEITSLEIALAEAKARAARIEHGAEQLRARGEALETQLAETEQAAVAAEDALREAEAELADLRRAVESHESSEERAAARAQAADLAIGRAGALQRQLDEAISKLAVLERDAQIKNRTIEQAELEMTDRVALADRRTHEAEIRGREFEARLGESERRLQAVAVSNEQFVGRFTDLERRTRDAEARMVAAERSAATLQAQLIASQQRLATLEREVASAENVRSFAAETEREIAQLQRELREGRSKLTQMTLERARLATELRDALGDEATTNRRVRALARSGAPEHDPEETAALDGARIEAMVARTNELEKQLGGLERDNKNLRTQLADTEQRLREAIDGDEDDDSESTNTGSGVPLVVNEYVSTLEAAIESLRANVRVASNETAIMAQSESVAALSSAVIQAVENLDRARAAIRALAAAIGMTT